MHFTVSETKPCFLKVMLHVHTCVRGNSVSGNKLSNMENVHQSALLSCPHAVTLLNTFIKQLHDIYFLIF